MPDAFKDLIGQHQAVELLTQAVAQNRIAPAYLFSGPAGVGRSLAARYFIELLCSAGAPVTQQPSVRKSLTLDNHPDVLWVEPTYLHNGVLLSAKEAAAVGVKRKAPPQIRLEQIREIRQFLSRSPKEASRSVVVLEQAETITSSAANGLLKTLEEPGRATLILIAPTIESLLPTLVSRCQRIPFYSLNPSEMAQVLVKTGHDLILERPALLLMAQGSPGMAIARRQQLSRIPPDLLNALLALPKSLGDALELARQIDKTLDTEAQLWLMDYLQHSYWQSFLSPNIVQRLDLAKRTLLMKVQPRLVWEVTLLELGYGG